MSIVCCDATNATTALSGAALYTCHLRSRYGPVHHAQQHDPSGHGLIAAGSHFSVEALRTKDVQLGNLVPEVQPGEQEPRPDLCQSEAARCLSGEEPPITICFTVH